jgi:D-alanyl-D-alanine dipeptidase
MDLPIPPIPGIAGRESVPVEENGEGLVPLSQVSPGTLRVYPEYYLAGYVNATLECYVRETVARMLVEASVGLPRGLRLTVVDGWRPKSLQRVLFDKFRVEVAAKNPGMSEEQTVAATRRYVAYPSDDGSAPAPHVTGGAVDVRLDDEKGQALWMGTEVDRFGPRVATRYFEAMIEAGEPLGERDLVAAKNRRLLYHALSSVGFTNYDEEWWHFDFGDQFWGQVANRRSCYGPARL